MRPGEQVAVSDMAGPPVVGVPHGGRARKCRSRWKFRPAAGNEVAGGAPPRVPPAFGLWPRPAAAGRANCAPADPGSVRRLVAVLADAILRVLVGEFARDLEELFPLGLGQGDWGRPTDGRGGQQAEGRETGNETYG